VSLAIVHSISLPPGEYGGPAIEDFFRNRLDCAAHPYYAQLRDVQVSAHFVIRRDGQVLQFVDADRRAWHAGRSSWRGRDNCNDVSIGIELEGLEGLHFERAQYAALARLLRAVGRRYPVREAVGHEHVAPGRKADPGAGFDWAWLRRTLRPGGGWVIGLTPVFMRPARPNQAARRMAKGPATRHRDALGAARAAGLRAGWNRRR
jgi:AmpD protein